MDTTSGTTIGEWTHVVAVMDTNNGNTWYINGVKDSFYDISTAVSRDPPRADCLPVRIGVKDQAGRFPINGAVDDIKYWYKKLTAEGKNFLSVTSQWLCLFKT